MLIAIFGDMFILEMLIWIIQFIANRISLGGALEKLRQLKTA